MWSYDDIDRLNDDDFVHQLTFDRKGNKTILKNVFKTERDDSYL